MAYTVLARKYRPQSFDDLVGQEHVARTLGNAIESGRVAHAFLFTGVRGVGKTTTARLLAKALNCETGPTPAPCNACQICSDITQGLDLDVLEMDGASNNSVDDVRRLQESIPYRPTRDRFKVIIVDEVHMLSTGAFNAFLKTLEEPPAHVKFIFATTESHKVPVTIRSRCQRYDFRLIPQAVVAQRVRTILHSEQLEADDEAVAMVAREAAGSMRDALTLLDQIVAASGPRIVGKEVERALGIAGRDVVFETLDAVLRGDPTVALVNVEQVTGQGLDLLHFTRQLLALIRDLVVLRIADAAGSLVDLVEEERTRAAALAQKVDVLELQRAFAAIASLTDEVGRASTPRVALEMGLVRLATRPPLLPLAELLGRLERLEQRLSGGGSGSSGGTRRPPTPQRSEPGAGPLRGGAGSAAGEERTPPQHSVGPFARVAPAATPPATAATSPAPTASSPAPTASSPAPAATPPAPPGLHRASTPAPATTAGAARVTAPHTDTASSAPAVAAAAAATAGADPDLAAWERVLHQLRESKPALAAVLEHGAPLAVGPERLTIGFEPGSFFGKQAEAPEALAAIADGAERVLGSRPSVEVRFVAELPKGQTIAQTTAQRRNEERETMRREALNHPGVLEAMQVFPETAGKVEVHVEGD